MKVQDILEKVELGVDFKEEPLETQWDALSCVWLPESKFRELEGLEGLGGLDLEDEPEAISTDWSPEKLALWEATQAKWKSHRERTDPMTEEERVLCVEALHLLDPNEVFGNAQSPNTTSKHRNDEFASLEALFEQFPDPRKSFEEGFTCRQLDPPVFRFGGVVNHNYGYADVDMAALDFHSQTIEDMPYADLCRAFLTLQEHSYYLFGQYTDFPESVLLDENGFYHSEVGPAVRYRDGVEHYYRHGSMIHRDQILGLQNQYASNKEIQDEYRTLYTELNFLRDRVREVGLLPDVEKQIRDVYFRINGYECSAYIFNRIVGYALDQYENRDKPPRVYEFDQWDDLGVIVLSNNEEG